MSAAVEELFRVIDEPFINFKERVDPIVWQGNDVLIQQSFEVKIPCLPGSIVTYTFGTTGGDIELSSYFQSKGKSPEAVVKATRVPSDVETVTGTIKELGDGTLVLHFDNSFSWLTSKLLTYKISLYQPAFTVADANRCTKSRRLLHSASEHTKQAELKMAECMEKKAHVENEIAQLQSMLDSLQTEFNQKREVLVGAEKETKDMGVIIMHNLEKRNGLCIRCLDNQLLGAVLSYLGKQSGAYIACKYWKASLDNHYDQSTKQLTEHAIGVESEYDDEDKDDDED